MAEEQKDQNPADLPPDESLEAAEQNAGPGDDRVAELEKQLAEAQAKADANWNEYLRSRAEMENQRKRAQRDVEQARKFAIERFANDLLGVIDSLEMGISAADEGADVEKLKEGSQLTLKMMQQVMERHELQPLEPKGEKFDPEKHEAMAMQESADHDPNTIMHVVQKGYLLKDRLLRPAMVVVAKAPASPPGSQIDDQA